MTDDTEPARGDETDRGRGEGSDTAPADGRRRAVGGAGPDPLDEPDFADEHTSATFADQQRGGPEGIAEPETPQGYAGMEPRGPDRRNSEEPGEETGEEPDD